MSGIIVAPGHRDSSKSWLRSSVQKLKEYRVLHLCEPPPIACIHLAVHPLCLLTVDVVSLGSKNQIPRKFRVSVERADTLHGVSKMELKLFISNANVLALERWAARQIVDDRIEFVGSMI
jgi:hypothetical protein